MSFHQKRVIDWVLTLERCDAGKGLIWLMNSLLQVTRSEFRCRITSHVHLESDESMSQQGVDALLISNDIWCWILSAISAPDEVQCSILIYHYFALTPHYWLALSLCRQVSLLPLLIFNVTGILSLTLPDRNWTLPTFRSWNHPSSLSLELQPLARLLSSPPPLLPSFPKISKHTT